MAPSNKQSPMKVECEVRMCNMSPQVQEAALEVVKEAFGSGSKVEKDLATQIKRGMDTAQEIGGTWHCIVGQDFGASVCFDNKFLLFLKVPTHEKHVLLFRSYDQ